MKYTLVKIKNIDVYVARVRHSRNFRITIKNDGNAYATYPWYSSKIGLLEFLDTKIDWIAKQQSKMRNQILMHKERLTKDELKCIIEQYVKKYLELFRIDGYIISIKKISLRQMTTRFGSCTPSNKTIRFSTSLCKYSDKFIEYVVVHELAHLIECSHNKRFWAIVAHYIPDYKSIDKFEV